MQRINYIIEYVSLAITIASAIAFIYFFCKEKKISLRMLLYIVGKLVCYLLLIAAWLLMLAIVIMCPIGSGHHNF